MTTATHPPPRDAEPLCAICGDPLADNWLPHADRCDTCARYRPPAPAPAPPPEPEPCGQAPGLLVRFAPQAVTRKRRLTYAD